MRRCVGNQLRLLEIELFDIFFQTRNSPEIINLLSFRISDYTCISYFITQPPFGIAKYFYLKEMKPFYAVYYYKEPLRFVFSCRQIYLFASKSILTLVLTI